MDRKVRLEDAFLGECNDILHGVKRNINLGSLGEVQLIDCSPRLAPDGYKAEHAMIRSARTSFGKGLDNPEKDAGLVNYLVRNQHTSPSEFMRVVFRVKCPIFVARQIMRHRTSSINEFSQRYAKVINDFDEENVKSSFYCPEVFRSPSKINKQSSEDEFENEMLMDLYNDVCVQAFMMYGQMLDRGVSKEMARMILPLSTLTEFYITMDMNNLSHFFKLRCDIHTQKETRIVSNAMYELARQVSPVYFESWEKNQLNALTFTQDELRVLSSHITGNTDDIVDSFNTKSVSAKNDFFTKIDSLRKLNRK
jgi:thymidylate synthase (FAD)